MFRIGIIGCGKIAQVRHLPEYAANPDVQIAALTDLNEERTRELASRYGAKAYASAVELLADPSIDAVSICSANNSHAEMTIAALKAGKHVLCEKPMATTLEDCEAMARTARQAGKLLMIDQNQRLAPAHQKAREWINAGKIGRPLTFRTRFAHGGPETWSADPGSGTWFFDRKLAAMGVLADLGIHKTDLIQFLLGQKVTEVTAFLTTLDKRFSDGSLISLDDNALCLYKMSGGAVGTMTASWTHYGKEDNSTEIDGTEGIAAHLRRPGTRAGAEPQGWNQRNLGRRRDSNQRRSDPFRNYRPVRRMPEESQSRGNVCGQRSARHAGCFRGHSVLQGRQDCAGERRLTGLSFSA